jgi:hypothetical protein
LDEWKNAKRASGKSAAAGGGPTSEQYRYMAQQRARATKHRASLRRWLTLASVSNWPFRLSATRRRMCSVFKPQVHGVFLRTGQDQE